MRLTLALLIAIVLASCATRHNDGVTQQQDDAMTQFLRGIK